MRRVHVTIRGRVQGVFFRASCADRARAAGLTGWVRNTPLGDVEAEFEGQDTAVETMMAWCRTGPPSARVEEVEIAEIAPHGGVGFRIAD
jgi:acylphosphatase